VGKDDYRRHTTDRFIDHELSLYKKSAKMQFTAKLF